MAGSSPVVRRRGDFVLRAVLGTLSLGAIGGAVVGAPQADAPAFSRDIAPILYGQCAPCHRPGGPAPFSLLTYADARQHATQIADATRRRFMPPWKPEPEAGPFVGERRLTDAQIVLLNRWAATGAAPGEAANLPAPPRETDGWPLGKPDLIVTLPEYQQRPDGPDVFRNFVVTVPGAGTRYVRGLTFRPGIRDYRVTDSYVLPVDAEVHAIQPHAHYRARRVETWATLPDGTRRSLLEIRDWDFNWQDQYRYASPFWLPAGTRLDMAFTFDNSDDNPRNPDHPAARVSWGWRTADEMGDVWVQVMTRTDADRARLSSDVRRKMATEDTIGCETLIAREPEYVDLRNDAALPECERAVRLRTIYPEAHFNLARAYAMAGRFDDAIRAATTADEQAGAAGKTALSAQIREQLRGYRERR